MLANWLGALIPDRYKASIAIKKVAYLAGKLAGGYLTAKLVTKGHITADMATQYQLEITAGVAAVLEAVHDWAKLKWPENKWL